MNGSEAARLVEKWGGLAAWCLNPRVLEAAEQYRRRLGGPPVSSAPATAPLPTDRGSCWLVMANPDADPTFRPAFLVPLCWRAVDSVGEKTPAAAANLWPRLRDLAAEVVERLSTEAETAAHLRHRLGVGDRGSAADAAPLHRFQLQLHPALGPFDFNHSNIDWPCRSGSASLLVGLYLAQYGGQPRSDVWASIDVDRERGLQEVAHLELKLQLAAERGVKQFFVADSDAVKQQVASWQDRSPPTAMQVRRLPMAEQDLLASLREYRNELFARPHPADPPEARVRYFIDQQAGALKEHPIRTAYYREVFLPEVIVHCRRQIAERWPGWTPTRLATLVSPSRDLMQMVTSLAPHLRQLLLLVDATTPDTLKLAEQLRGDYAEQRGEDACTVLRFERGDPQLTRRFREFLQHNVPVAEQGDLMVDLTAGAVDMTVSLVFAVPRSAKLICWYTQFDSKSRCAIPLTEQLYAWDRDLLPVPGGPAFESSGVAT